MNQRPDLFCSGLRLSRRAFLGAVGAAGAGRLLASVPTPSIAQTAALRRDVVEAPIGVALHRARVFTDVFRAREADPWVARKGAALRKYFETVPLYVRPHDGIAGSISETAGAMPVMVELGIAENPIYLSENPMDGGYLTGKVPEDIRDYWANRNLWGLHRTQLQGLPPVASHDDLPPNAQYKLISNQGHLSPAYGEVLRAGLGGVLEGVRARRARGADADGLAFLAAAEDTLEGLSTWIRRYADHLADEAGRMPNAARAAELREMARVAAAVATDPPSTFREALQLVWFVHQAVHIEGHGYSCTPDRIDQILFPFYEADVKAGRLDEPAALRLAENFVLKQYDNSYWGPRHHLTQGLCVGGSSIEGRDQTNRLSWMFVEAHTNLVLPEPLLWMRWHPAIDQKFFDFCLTRLERSTCFPMIWSDAAIPDALVELGIRREDAVNYVPVGCNELAVPGKWYYNPAAHCGYLDAIQAALTGGRGHQNQWKWSKIAPPPSELNSFDAFAAAVGAYIRAQMDRGRESQMKQLEAQIRWGKTPLTSCFFDGCVERTRDMADGTDYNFLSCGGIAFSNAVDCLAAVREVVYEKNQATLADIAKACADNFKGHERLQAKLIVAPKHGNDDPRLDDIIRLVERLRDEPMMELCRDPRDGSRFGNSHVVRSGAVKGGLRTPATPDGRLAGTPLASSVGASVGCERNGPTAMLNSVCKLNSSQSWQCGYQVNIRFHTGMIASDEQRAKLREMLNAYFAKGGQELQINVVSAATLLAAKANPELYQDLVVRIAGFSEFFVRLTPELQNELIARTEHG